MAHINRIPPDGGWGWIIVLALAMSNIVTMPVITNFGLIFKDKLTQIQMPATNTSLIINLSSVFNMMMGIVTGPLLKFFGYRRVAFGAGICFSTGIILTSFANSFKHFIFTYSILAAAGNGLATAAFSLALNTYFQVNRNKAAGIAMTITGFGPILYPQLVTMLLSAYGVQGCVLLLGAISTHIFVAAALLQPVKCHYKYETSESIEDLAHRKPSRTSSVWDYSSEEEEDYLEKPLKDDDAGRRMVNFKIAPDKLGSRNDIDRFESKHSFSELYMPQKNAARNSRIRSWIMEVFDLDLLKDKIFVNIIAGLAIASYAEINFSVLTPFILSELDFSNFEIATAMSTLAIADITARFVSPFVGDYLGLSPRVMYMISLAFLITTRMSVILVETNTDLLIVFVCMGFSKGVRTVYMILVIPSHVNIDKLASASGIRMVSNGIVLLALGPIVGMIRDAFGNYVMCIVFMNIVTFLCITMWTCEMLYIRFMYQSSDSSM